MNVIEFIVEIIDNIPSIMQYFVSGRIFIAIVRYFGIKKFAHNNTTIFSCVISYFFVSIIRTINEITINSEVVEKTIVISCISIFIAIVSAIIFNLIVNSDWFKKFTLKFFHKTIYDDIWQDVFDLKRGTNLKIYLKDKDYYIVGHYKFNEEKGDESWMALSAHGIYNKETGKLVGQGYHSNDNVIITIRMRDVEQIEVF